MKNKPHLVISRYNEDISWVDDTILENFNVFVYNKGSNLGHIHLNRFNIIEIENTGRESHTYLHHIIEKYEFILKKINLYEIQTKEDFEKKYSQKIINLYK